MFFTGQTDLLQKLCESHGFNEEVINELRSLSMEAKQIADKAIPHVYDQNQNYFAQVTYSNAVYFVFTVQPLSIIIVRARSYT